MQKEQRENSSAMRALRRNSGKFGDGFTDVMKCTNLTVADDCHSCYAKYDILINEQFGFRKSHSTSHGVLNLTNYVTNELDNGNFCLGILMDLSKAFDTIDHVILLDKLSCYGVRGIALNWFRSYLTSRKQCVVVDGVKSNFQEMTCGVPRGSVLGIYCF